MRETRHVGLLLSLGAASGCAALAYEVLWTRELLNLLGSTTRAGTIVLASFMSGLAIGAGASGRWSDRLRQPLWLYVVAESALVALAVTFRDLVEWADSLGPIGVVPALAAILVVAAALMGVAVPALAASLQEASAVAPRFMARLYGLNALGGSLSALVVGFALLPQFGLRLTETMAAALGAAAALIAAGVAWRWQGRPLGTARDELSPVTRPIARLTPIFLALFLSGAAALGYEVLWTRTLVLVTGSSTNAFTAMLGLYVLGLAAGGLLVGRVIDRAERPLWLFQWLQVGVAATALGGTALVSELPGLALLGHALLGPSGAAGPVVSLVLAAIVILPPTVAIGASLPVGARLLQGRRIDRGREIGLALAIVTCGNVVGVVAAAYLVIPWLGLRHGLAALAMLNVAAALLAYARGHAQRSRRRWLVPAAATALIALIPVLPAWDAAVMTSGVFRHAPTYLAMLGSPGRLARAFAEYRTRYYREGSEAVVAVFDRPTIGGPPHRILSIDGKVDASTGADMATQVLSGHLPLLFRPDAVDALVVGLASGVTVGALATHDLERIDVAEIEPAVVEASRLFDAFSGAPLRDPRVRIAVDDGRRFLRATAHRYDIIVSVPSNPWLSMSARLFTREFFELARSRLTERGLLVQWVPLYALGERHLAALLRTLLEVFSYTAVFRSAEGDLLVVAGARPLSMSIDAVRRLFEADKTQVLREAGFGSPAEVLGRWVADGAALRDALGEGPLNTDDNGLLEFGSPWFLLTDSIAENAALVERAGAAASYIDELVQVISAGEDGTLIDAIARHHLEAGRASHAWTIAEALRARGSGKLADLIAGDVAMAEGREDEAERLWSRHDSSAFARRRASAAFRRGDPATAGGLLSRVPVAELTAEDRLVLALSRSAEGRASEALATLDRVEWPVLSSPDTMSALVASCLYRTGGDMPAAALARERFEKSLDALRGCLETEGCRPEIDSLVRWSEAPIPGFPNGCREELRQGLYLHVLRPAPLYFQGVSRLWLGDHEESRRALERYLALLPREDPKSRAHELLTRLRGSAGPLVPR